MTLHYFGLDFTPDCKKVLFGSYDNLIHQVDLRTHTELSPFLGLKQPPYKISISPTGDMMAIWPGRDLAKIHICDPETGVIFRTLSFPKLIGLGVWGPEGKVLAVPCADRRIHFYNAKTGEQLACTQQHPDPSFNIGYSPKGNLVFSRTGIGKTRLWNPKTGKLLLTDNGKGARQFSLDGKLLCFLSGRGNGMWRINRSKILQRISAGLNNSFRYSVDFSPDGKLLVCGGNHGAHFYDTVTRNKIYTIKHGIIYSASFLSNNSLLTSGSAGLIRWLLKRHDDHLEIYSPEVLSKLQPMRAPRSGAATNGQYLVSIQGSQVAIFDQKINEFQTFPDKHPKATFVSITPDGEWVATGTWGGHGVKIWKTPEKKIISDLWSSTGNCKVSFSPNGKWLAAGSNLEYRIWKVGSWKLIHSIPRPPTTHSGVIAFSPNGQMLAISYTREIIYLINTSNWKVLAALEGPDLPWLESLTFSPDSAKLVAGTLDDMIYIWDLQEIRKELSALDLDWDMR